MVSENACSTRLGDRGDGPETLSALQRSRHGFRRSGPHLRSTAIYLRNVIGISYRKIPQAIEELFGITFTPAALIGFETRLAEKAKPVVDDIAKKLGSSDEAVEGTMLAGNSAIGELSASGALTKVDEPDRKSVV